VSILSNNFAVIRAPDFIDANQELVASGFLLAKAVTELMAKGQNVTVDLAGLRSVSSSYFNTVLSAVADQCGIEAVRTRLLFLFPSRAQHEIFKRSFDAVLRNYGV
jgi:hypothetical protein